MADRHYNEHCEPVWLTDLAKNLAHMTDIEARTEEGAATITHAAEISTLRNAGELSEEERRARTNVIWNPLHFFTVPLLFVLGVGIQNGRFGLDVGSLFLLTITLLSFACSIAPVLEYLQIGYRDGRILRTEVEYRIVR